MIVYSLQDLDQAGGDVQLLAEVDNSKLCPHPVPNPDDPNDPLRWSKWKRHAAFASICAFTLATDFAYAGINPALLRLVDDFEVTPTEVTRMAAWVLIALGLCNFIWVPLGNYLGKRPVFVLTAALYCGSVVWAALAQSFHSLLCANVLSGIAGSSAEALGASVVADLYFLHERGLKMGIYLGSLLTGITIGPLICGFLITDRSWRLFYWVCLAPAGLSFFLILLCYPETRYELRQTTPAGMDNDLGCGNGSILRAEECGDACAAAEKEIDIETRSRSESSHAANLGAQRSWLQEKALWPRISEQHGLLVLFLRPFTTLVYPAVMFAWLCYTVPMAWIISMSIFSTFVLQAPPYNWEPRSSGLINIAGLVGAIAGVVGGGWSFDRYVRWRSSKNAGVFVPETRLHLVFVPGLLVGVGCLAFGYGAARHLHWTALFFGLGMASTGYAAANAAITYVSDCYLPLNADALVVITGLKNVAAFGFTYVVVPWVEREGFVRVFGTEAGVFLLVTLLSLPLVVYGPQIRRVCAHWRVNVR